MKRFYALAAVMFVAVSLSAGVLVSVLFSLTPDQPDTPGGGPPELPGLMQRRVQAREVIEDKKEVVQQKQQIVDFRMENFIREFQSYESRLNLSVQQLESSLRMTQAPLRSAAQRFNMSVQQLDAYNAQYDAQRRYAQEMAAKMAVYGGGDMVPAWDPSYLNNALAAKGEFEIAYTQFQDSLENERVRANMDLARLQQEIIGTLNNLASLQVESLSNQSEVLALYEQLIGFVNQFGRLAKNPVNLPPNVRLGDFTGETWRALLDALMAQARSGMSADAVAKQAAMNILQDQVIQMAIQNHNRPLRPLQ